MRYPAVDLTVRAYLALVADIEPGGDSPAGTRAITLFHYGGVQPNMKTEIQIVTATSSAQPMTSATDAIRSIVT